MQLSSRGVPLYIQKTADILKMWQDIMYIKYEIDATTYLNPSFEFV